MKREAEIKDAFISNAIHLIAVGGFEIATTKALSYSASSSTDIKTNEVYIYRIFGSKEKLYEATFARLDSELYLALMKGIESLGGITYGDKVKLYSLFLPVWEFVLSNEERCRCYIRYYYSTYFRGEILEAHNKLFSGVLKHISPLFKDKADVVSIMHSVFTSLLDFSIRVYNGDLSNNEDTREHVFNVLYCMMESYFKN